MTQDIISTLNEAHEETPKHATGFKSAVRQKLGKFRKDEDGSLIIFSLYIFIITLVVGGIAVDIMRSEYQRTKIQYTTDRALLAAASLKQTVPAQEVFDDYFAKSGMAGLAPVATVDASLNYRKVSAAYPEGQTPKIETIFMSHAFRNLLQQADSGGLDTLFTSAAGTAVDGVEKVEISLVLDVSGSMGWGSASGHSKLYDLKEAANEFVDTLLLNQPEDDTYSISIIPFSTQVNVGENLLSKYNVSSEHNYSHCVDFEGSDFDTAALSTGDALQRTGHFAPWSTYYWTKPVNWKRRPCPPNVERAIMPLSGDNVELKNYVEDFVASGNTSADIGLKWGAAMLDPSAQSVVSSLISDGDVDAKFEGRPFSYTETNTLKVIVLMSDGANTSQYYLEPEVSGGYANSADNMSNVWHKVDSSNRDRYAIYNPNRWDSKKYFRTYIESTNGYWSTTPRSGMTQLSYVELYDHATVRYIAKYLMDPAGYSYNYWRYGVYDYVGSGTKDTRMDNICSAAKNNEVLIFTIGFEVTDSNATKLTNCATSAGHFFRVDGVNISEAFASIAAQLNSLRLTH